jgi:hypothetical protein
MFFVYASMHKELFLFLAAAACAARAVFRGRGLLAFAVDQQIAVHLLDRYLLAAFPAVAGLVDHAKAALVQLLAGDVAIAKGFASLKWISHGFHGSL